jgi:ferric enterobactin receptor
MNVRQRNWPVPSRSIVFPLCAVACISLLFAIQVRANEEQRDISGYVLDDQSGESLPYATILLKGQDRGALTNADGYFVIVNAPAIPCTLEVSFIGYASRTHLVDNAQPAVEPIEIQLQVQTIGLEQTVVTAEEEYQVWKRSDQVSQITFSPRQIETLPNLGEADIFRSLQLLPGISGANEGSAGLYVRGGTPDQNLVIYDGMTVYHVDHFFGMFSAFNADAVKDVQLYKGGYPAKFGGRLSSVVELTGKSGDVDDFRFSMGANLLSSHALMELPLAGKGSWVLSARRSYTDFIESGLYTSLFNQVEEEENSPAASLPMGRRGGGRMLSQEVGPLFYFYDLNSKLTLSPTPNDVLALSLYGGRDNLNESSELEGLRFKGFGATDGVAEEDPSGTRTQENETDWGNLGASLKWARQWHSRLYTNLLLSTSTYSSTYFRNQSFTGSNTGEGPAGGNAFRFASAYEEDNTVEDLTLSFTGEWHAHSAHKIDFGASVARLSTDYLAAFGDTVETLDIDAQARQTSLYFQDRWTPLRPLEFTLGMRATQYDQTDEFYYSPRFSFGWFLTDRVKLKGAWGQYYQFVNNISSENVLQGSRSFWLVADSEMEPSFSEHTILGLSYENRQFLFEIEGYYKDLDGLIEFSSRVGRRRQADYLGSFFFGTGIARGVEFLAQKKAGSLNGWISYTLGEVEHTFEKFDDGDPFPADHDRRHEVNAVGSYRWGPWNLSATWIFATGRAYTAPESQYSIQLANGGLTSYVHVGKKNSFRLPDYHRLDLGLSRDFETSRFDWTAGLTLFNAYNRTNVHSREYDFEVIPVVVTDATTLGFTPTLSIKATLK